MIGYDDTRTVVYSVLQRVKDNILKSGQGVPLLVVTKAANTIHCLQWIKKNNIMTVCTSAHCMNTLHPPPLPLPLFVPLALLPCLLVALPCLATNLFENYCKRNDSHAHHTIKQPARIHSSTDQKEWTEITCHVSQCIQIMTNNDMKEVSRPLLTLSIMQYCTYIIDQTRLNNARGGCLDGEWLFVVPGGHFHWISKQTTMNDNEQWWWTRRTTRRTAIKRRMKRCSNAAANLFMTSTSAILSF